MAKKKCCVDKINLMAIAYQNGETTCAIAKTHGYSVSQVGRLLRGAGYAMRACGPRTVGRRDRFERYACILDQDACVPWSGFISAETGYGQFAWKTSTSIGAHVASYLIYKGAVPAGMLVRHTCDNRSCVNPKHLLLGTYVDNMRDAMERRRVACGERAHSAKMTAAKVADLRQKYAAGARQVDLAIEFGVGQAAVSQMVRRGTWKHVP